MLHQEDRHGKTRRCVINIYVEGHCSSTRPSYLFCSVLLIIKGIRLCYVPTQLSPNKLHFASFPYSKFQDLFFPLNSIPTSLIGALTTHHVMLTHLHRSRSPFRAFLGELAHATALGAVTHQCAACGLVPVHAFEVGRCYTLCKKSIQIVDLPNFMETGNESLLINTKDLIHITWTDCLHGAVQFSLTCSFSSHSLLFSPYAFLVSSRWAARRFLVSTQAGKGR